MRNREGDASGLALFAAELAAHRARAGLSQDELGSQIRYSGSLVAMIESMRRAPKLDFAKRCDEALSTPGTFVAEPPASHPYHAAAVMVSAVRRD